MQKSALVLLICLFVGFSASAARTKPASLRPVNKESVKNKKRMDCISFTWTPSCASAPMGSDICGDDLPWDMWGLMWLIKDTQDEIEEILCGGANAGGGDWDSIRGGHMTW